MNRYDGIIINEDDVLADDEFSRRLQRRWRAMGLLARPVHVEGIGRIYVCDREDMSRLERAIATGGDGKEEK